MVDCILISERTRLLFIHNIDVNIIATHNNNNNWPMRQLQAHLGF